MFVQEENKQQRIVHTTSTQAERDMAICAQEKLTLQGRTVVCMQYEGKCFPQFMDYLDHDKTENHLTQLYFLRHVLHAPMFYTILDIHLAIKTKIYELATKTVTMAFTRAQLIQPEIPQLQKLVVQTIFFSILDTILCFHYSMRTEDRKQGPCFQPAWQTPYPCTFMSINEYLYSKCNITDEHILRPLTNTITNTINHNIVTIINNLYNSIIRTTNNMKFSVTPYHPTRYEVAKMKIIATEIVLLRKKISHMKHFILPQ